MAATKEEFALARVAFEAWAKSLQGSGDTLKQREEPAESVQWPTPADWDDLDEDQQEVWIDVTREMNIGTLEAQLAQASTDLEDAKETHAAELSTIGERLGLLGPDTCGAPTGLASNRCLRRVNHAGGHDCQTLIDTPAAEEIVERLQQLLTELQNSTRCDLLASDLQLPRMETPHTLETIVAAVNAERQKWIDDAFSKGKVAGEAIMRITEEREDMKAWSVALFAHVCRLSGVDGKNAPEEIRKIADAWKSEFAESIRAPLQAQHAATVDGLKLQLEQAHEALRARIADSAHSAMGGQGGLP